MDTDSKQDISNDQEDNEDGSRSKQEGSNNEEDKEDINSVSLNKSDAIPENEDNDSRSKQEGSKNKEDKEDISVSLSKSDAIPGNEDSDSRSTEEWKDKLAGEDKEIERLKEESGEKDKKIGRMQEECSKYKEKLKQKDLDFGRLEGTCSQNKIQLDEKDNTIKSLQQELQDLKSSSESFNDVFQRAIDEQDMLKDELKASTTQVERLKGLEAKASAIEIVNKKLSETNRVLAIAVEEKKAREKTIKEDAKKKLERMEIQWKKKLQGKEDELKRMETQWKKELQGKEAELKRIHENYRTEKSELVNNWTSYIDRMQADLDKKDDAVKQIQRKLDLKDGALQRLQDSVENVRKERDDYQVRLSALMSTKLTANNPEITDLSDINRPTKLAEQWSELYDNEYTDLFEALQFDEKRKISLILKLLKRSFEICQEIKEQGVHWLGYCRSENNTMHNPLPKKEKKGIKEPLPNEDPGDHEDPESASSKGEKNDGKQVSHSNGETGDDGGQDSASSLGDKNKGGEVQENPDTKSEIDNKEEKQVSHSNEKTGDDGGQDSASSLCDKNASSIFAKIKGGEGQENPDTKSEIDNKKGKQVSHSNEKPGDDGGQDSASSLGDKNKGGEDQENPDTKSEIDNKKGGEDQENPDTKSEIDNKEGTKESRSNGEPGDEGGQDSASSLGDKNEGDESQVNPDPKDGIKDTIDDNQKPTMNRYSQTAMAEMVTLDVPDELKRKLMLELSPYLKKKALEFVDILNKKLPESVAKEFDMAWNTGDALDIYLKSCIRLCWLMVTKSPPVYIRFDEQDQTTRHAKLDKHFYREYTKAGQYIDYVVWPPLQLHKDGPLLQRGVAQGTDSKD